MIDLSQAQIALIHPGSWALLGPFFHSSGLFPLHPLPQVSCLALEVSACDPDRLAALLRKFHPTPEGISDVGALVQALCEIGARPIPTQELGLLQRVESEAISLPVLGFQTVER
jgi:hypothetical protein